jgi:N-acyl-phosphatidylethanolamine-hydrolysing phospholipase D
MSQPNVERRIGGPVEADGAAPGARPLRGRDSRYRNPWPDLPPEPRRGDVFQWAWQRFWSDLPPNPRPDQIPRTEPTPARPRLAAGEAARVTWIGHASFLLQLPGANVLTDPVFGPRASPLTWAGPKRFVRPGLAIDALPPIDAVLVSHDHYDHLDAWSVARLSRGAAKDATWYAPPGYRAWFRRRGVERVLELDWWEEAELASSPGLRVRSLPARHWTRRRPWEMNRRLWCSYAASSEGIRAYFGGDSGYGPFYREIGERAGPFDLVLLPIGAYEPRWFMAASHMNPEEAAQAFRDLGRGAATFVAMHWGTFRLTDEDPLEPPERIRRAWSALGLPERALHVLAVGETVAFSRKVMVPRPEG